MMRTHVVTQAPPTRDNRTHRRHKHTNTPLRTATLFTTLATATAYCIIQPDANGHVDLKAEIPDAPWIGVRYDRFAAWVPEMGPFYQCKELKTISIPDTVRWIGWQAFAYSGLTTLDLPNSVTFIDIYGFVTANITTANLGSLRDQGPMILRQNPLTSIWIPDTLTSIAEGMLYQTDLTSIRLPDSINYIGDFALNFAPLEGLDIPDSVTSIGEGAFSGCDSLEFVNFGDSLNAIGRSAFMDTWSLTSMSFLTRSRLSASKPLMVPRSIRSSLATRTT